MQKLEKKDVQDEEGGLGWRTSFRERDVKLT